MYIHTFIKNTDICISYFYVNTHNLWILCGLLGNKISDFSLKITVNNKKWLAVIIATIFFLLKHSTITFPLVQSLTCEKVQCKSYEMILIWLLGNNDTSHDVVWYKCTSSIYIFVGTAACIRRKTFIFSALPLKEQIYKTMCVKYIL